MALPCNDHEVGIWIEAIADFVDVGDFDRAMCAISELSTYFVLLDFRLEPCNGKAQAGFEEVRPAGSGRSAPLR